MSHRILPQQHMDASGLLPQEACEDNGAPESWEADDVVERMKKLLPPSLCIHGYKDEPLEFTIAMNDADDIRDAATIKALEQVDSFLRDALQNSRDRLTILRLEKEVDRFMRNRQQQILEFQPMASSYLRLVAHRVAQHYFLKSMVVDCNTPEGTRIIAQKTHESRFPAIRLADIPVKQPQEEALNVAIKRRPQKGMLMNGDSSLLGDFSAKNNPAKSVEERKEEYNRARERIFSAGDLCCKVSDENWIGESSQNREVFPIKVEGKWIAPVSGNASNEGFFTDRVDSIDDDKADRELFLRGQLNTNRVAIFRDREKDRKDPDYDRNYDRYMQHFDPGFGLNVGPLNMQAIYAPLTNYNSEFPHLGPPLRPQVHVDPSQQQHSRPPQIQGSWVASNPANYRLLDPMVVPFNPGHMGLPSRSGLYLHAPQFTCPRPGTTIFSSQDRFQQSLAQTPMQHDSSFSHARCL